MKIVAEFNSTQELVNFIGAFGTKGIECNSPKQIVSPSTEIKKIIKNESNKSQDKPLEVAKVVKEEIKGVVTPKEIETSKNEAEKEKKEEPKITKEMIRERLGSIMKSGKQKEAKELLAKHGASRLPELKEEYYTLVYKEAEVLI